MQRETSHPPSSSDIKGSTGSGRASSSLHTQRRMPDTTKLKIIVSILKNPLLYEVFVPHQPTDTSLYAHGGYL